MADAIERIIEPYVDEDMAIRGHRNLILACAMAWNLCVMEHRDDQSNKGDLEAARADVDRLGVTVVVEALKKRKMALFPADHRFIVNTSVKPLRGGGWYLNVTSIAPEQREHDEPAPADGDPLRQPPTAEPG